MYEGEYKLQSKDLMISNGEKVSTIQTRKKAKDNEKENDFLYASVGIINECFCWMWFKGR